MGRKRVCVCERERERVVVARGCGLTGWLLWEGGGNGGRPLFINNINYHNAGAPQSMKVISNDNVSNV